MSDTLTTDQRVAIARYFVNRVFNEHQPELAREYVTPGVVWHGGSLGTVSGVDGLTGLLTAFIPGRAHQRHRGGRRLRPRHARLLIACRLRDRPYRPLTQGGGTH